MGTEKNTQGEFCNFHFESFSNIPCANKGPHLSTNPIFAQ